MGMATLATVVSTIGTVLLLKSGEYVLATTVMLLPPIVYAVVTWPTTATYLVVFLLYVNFPAVAMRYHGAPFIVGAAIPALLLIPVFYHVVFRRRGLVVLPAAPAIAIFVAVQAAGTALSPKPNVAFGQLMVSLIEGLMLFLLVSNAVRTAEQLRKVSWALVAAGAFMGGICFWQQITRTYDNHYGGFAVIDSGGFGVAEGHGTVRQPRFSGPIGVENRFAQIMLILVPLGLCCYWNERTWGLRIAAIAGTALTALGWALAFSRGSAIALVLAAIFGAAIGCIRPKQLLLIAVGSLLVLVAIPQYRTRLAKITPALGMLSPRAALHEEPDNAVKGRVTEMIAAAQVCADHPFIGVGPGVFKYYSAQYSKEGGHRALEGTRQAHNLFLGIAADHGVSGLLCYLAVVGVTLRELLQVRKQALRVQPGLAHLVTGFLLAIVVYLTTGIFEHFSFIRYFWLMLGLAGAAAYVVR